MDHGLIVDVWDEFVRIAASIRPGQCTAVEAIARFGSAARGPAVYDGGVHIGRLLRRIGPTHIEAINLRGTFNFPVSLYAKRILPSIAAANPVPSPDRSA